MLVKNKTKINNLIIIGPQGSGKGTQAQLLSKELSIPHISTGMIFREIITKDNALGRKVKSMYNKGLLVSPEIVDKLVSQRLKKADCKKGFVLDGYPRNISQANFLEKQKPINKAILVEISEEEGIKRISARRVCSDCKTDYNLIYLKPKKDDVCDKCEGKLVQRDDDKPEAIRKRLEIYRNETQPVIDYYEKKKILLRVNGARSIEKVFEDIVTGLKS